MSAPRVSLWRSSPRRARARWRATGLLLAARRWRSHPKPCSSSAQASVGRVDLERRLAVGVDEAAAENEMAGIDVAPRRSHRRCGCPGVRSAAGRPLSAATDRACAAAASTGARVGRPRAGRWRSPVPHPRARSRSKTTASLSRPVSRANRRARLRSRRGEGTSAVRVGSDRLGPAEHAQRRHSCQLSKASGVRANDSLFQDDVAVSRRSPVATTAKQVLALT